MPNVRSQYREIALDFKILASEYLAFVRMETRDKAGKILARVFALSVGILLLVAALLEAFLAIAALLVQSEPVPASLTVGILISSKVLALAALLSGLAGTVFLASSFFARGHSSPDDKIA